MKTRRKRFMDGIVVLFVCSVINLIGAAYLYSKQAAIKDEVNSPQFPSLGEFINLKNRFDDINGKHFDLVEKVNKIDDMAIAAEAKISALAEGQERHAHQVNRLKSELDKCRDEMLMTRQSKTKKTFLDGTVYGPSRIKGLESEQFPNEIVTNRKKTSDVEVEVYRPKKSFGSKKAKGK